MNGRQVPITGILFFTGFVAQTIASLNGQVWALLTALIWPVLFLWVTRFFEVTFNQLWLQVTIPASAVLIGTLVAYLGGNGAFEWSMWLAPLETAAVVGIAFLIGRSRNRRCSLCNSRIGRGVSFSCPRCELLVCERKCWNFDKLRCYLCEQNHVPLILGDGKWWDQRMGPRSLYGSCQLCHASAKDADLRVCGKCGRPHCRGCWDDMNGQCSRCDWSIADLPESFQPFIAKASNEGTTSAGSRKHYG